MFAYSCNAQNNKFYNLITKLYDLKAVKHHIKETQLQPCDVNLSKAQW